MFDTEVVALDAAATLAAVEANEHAFLQAESRRLTLAAHWADLHPGDALPPQRPPGSERPTLLGGRGTPEVADFCPAELGAVLRLSSASAALLMADALDLRHRLPSTWAALHAGQVPAYQARFIARSTRQLSADQAAWVDAEVAPCLGGVPFGRLQRLVEAKVYDADPETADADAGKAAAERFVRFGRSNEHGLKLIIGRATAGEAIWLKATIDRLADILRLEGDADPVDVRRSKALGILAQPAEALALLAAHQGDDADGPDDSERAETDDPGEAEHRSLRIGPPPFDPARARPRAVLYVHLSEEALRAGQGICRVEGVGPVQLSRLGQILGQRCSIALKPVIDLSDTPPPVDAYEIPARIREHLRLRQPADVFPYAPSLAGTLDLDHAVPYVDLGEGGPPGQTRIGNLAPLSRHHHRIKTHGRWRIRKIEPDIRVWRSPHGYVFVVNSSGTHALGCSAFAQQIWHAAAGPPGSGYEVYVPDAIIIETDCAA